MNKKLIRDKIPGIIEQDNCIPSYYAASDVEYKEELRKKLLEEVDEFLEDENPEELADILEVVYALCDLQNISKEELESLRSKKATERGSFHKKLILTEIRKKTD